MPHIFNLLRPRRYRRPEPPHCASCGSTRDVQGTEPLCPACTDMYHEALGYALAQRDTDREARMVAAYRPR